MAKKAPAMLTRGLSTTDAEAADRWWSALTPATRLALRGHPGRAPAGVIARFVDAREEDGRDEDGRDANIDFYEHLVNHEVYLVDAPPMHICTAHPAARAALAAGHVPASFACPRQDAACPMRALLDASPGSHVQFELAAHAPACGVKERLDDLATA